MRPIKIMTDSCSDITENIAKQYDVASINFTIYIDGKEISAEPWKDITPRNLYDTLRTGERAYTLPATEHEIKLKFKKYIADYDILYIAACEKQSTTITKAKKVAHELLEANPDARIEIVDSLNASIGELLVTLKACEYRDQNMSIEEIIEKVNADKNKVIQFATVETLTYLSKANKINARAAALGNLLRIKPILISDCEGNQTALKSVRGREKSINEIVTLFMENVIDPENQEVYIIHGDEIETAKIVKKELINRGFNCKGYHVFNVGPVVGITVGPGMVGLFGFGKEVTFKGE